MDSRETRLAGDSVSYSIAAPTPPIIYITANDGRPLLTIKRDGSVEGEIENASEAARLFVESCRGLLRQAATDAIAALKFDDARTPTELAHNAALSEAMAAICALPSTATPELPETGDPLAVRNL